MTEESRMLHVKLPEALRRAAAMRAAQAGENLSEYVTRLVEQDATELLPLVQSDMEDHHDHG